jgi:hypothetical protein
VVILLAIPANLLRHGVQSKNLSLSQSRATEHRRPSRLLGAATVPVNDWLQRPCPGYVFDHVQPLAYGGIDAPKNMQWQTIDASHRSVRNSAFGGESDFTALLPVPAELHDISGECDVHLISFRLGVPDAGRER